LGRAGRAAVQQLLPEARGAAWITIIGQARKGPRGDGFFVAWERALTVKAEFNKARVERARICNVVHEAAASRNAEVILTFPRAKATEVSKQ
jgi:hypothetical protein